MDDDLIGLFGQTMYVYDSSLHHQIDQRLLHLLKLIQAEEEHAKLAGCAREIVEFCAGHNWLVHP